jgi:hypothetical protein
MKKVILFFSLFFLIIVTSITKNSTKTIGTKIYNANENLRVLRNQYEMVLLDFNYLSSPKKLLEYQSKYFDNELKKINIINLNKVTMNENKLTYEKFLNSGTNE